MKTRRSIASKMKAKDETEEIPGGKDQNSGDKLLDSKVMEKVDKDEATKKPKLLRRSNVGLFDESSETSPAKLNEKIDNSKETTPKTSNKKEILKITPIKLVEKKGNLQITTKKVVSPIKTANNSILDESREGDNFGCFGDLCLIDDDYDEFYQEVCNVGLTANHNVDKNKRAMEVKSPIEVPNVMQKKRNQKKIVIVTDERTVLDSASFNKEVSVVTVYGLKLSNALSSIKTNPNFAKGTLFIILCGTHDLLTQVPLQECQNSKYCSNSVNIFVPSPAAKDVQYLVNEAKRINAEVLSSTENDIVIFCGLIPMDINQQNKFIRLNRECRLAHNVNQVPNVDSVGIKNYDGTVGCFNMFVNKYMEEIGFKPWNKDMINSCSTNLHQYKFFDKHVSICQVEQDKLQKEIKIKCNEVVQMWALSSSAKLTSTPVAQPSTPIVQEIIKQVEKPNIDKLEQLELLYKQDFQNIMTNQKGRVQNNIVIVTDDRDIFDVSLVGFNSTVEVLKIPNLSLNNAFGAIKNHKNFGKGTIFVFFCGIYDVLQCVSLEDCVNLKCKSPLKILALSPCIKEPKCLIECALKLSKEILENSPKDIALFSGLIPVAINQYNKATFKNRPCVSNHPALPALNIHAIKYNDYNSAIDWYNTFAKYYAETLGYSSWDLEKSYFCHAKPLSLLLPNGYSLCYDEKMKRLNRVKVLCNELMHNFPMEDSLGKTTNNKNIDETTLKKVTENCESTLGLEIKKPPIKIIIPSRATDQMQTITPMETVTPMKSATAINITTPIKTSPPMKTTGPMKTVTAMKTTTALKTTPPMKTVTAFKRITSDKTVAPINSITSIKTLPKTSTENIKEKVCKLYTDEDLSKVKSFYQLNLKKILEMQKGRTQNNIVIVTDERDNFDANLVTFDSRVTVMKIPGLRLTNALTSIKINKNFGKGTIFIFVCGTFDLLLSTPLKECIELNCKSPQQIFNLSSSYSDSHTLIKKALKLNLNVLQCTKNDMVLFSGLLPVDIDTYNNKFCLHERKCKLDHKALEVPNVDNNIYEAYVSAVKMFNDFTKYHAQTLNFAPWDLEVRCFLRDSGSLVKNLLLNGYVLCLEEEKERTADVKYLCSKLLASFPPAFEVPILKVEEIESASQAQPIIDSNQSNEKVVTTTIVKKEDVPVVNVDTNLATSATSVEEKNVKKYSDSFLGRISSVYNADMQKIIKLQKGRSPQNIVIYSDDRDHLDVNLGGFSRKVDIIKLPGMKLSNVFSLLKTHPGYGKGTIFIFLMGTHDLIQSVSLLDCLECQCPFRQTMLTLLPTSGDSHYLIKSALKLDLDILLTTTDDVALFCGLIPVRINVYNEFTIAKRPCGSLHPAFHVPNVDLFGYGNYRTNVLNYNNFTKYHAQSLGYEPWDLETPYFGKPKRNIMMPNMYNLRPDEEIKRANQVRALCTELLRKSTSETFVHMKEESIIQGDDKKMQILESKDVSASAINVPEHILKTLKRLYLDNVEKIMKLQMGRKQNNVVIVTDDRDNFDVHLRGFDHRVTILREPGLKLGSAFSSLKKHHKFGKGTIFVFSCGSHDLLQSVSLNDCLLSMCPFPQTMLTLPHAEGDTQYLIKKALQVNIDILLSTENDIALFCGIIPVRINHYNTYTVDNRPCQMQHSAIQIPNVDLEKYTNYRETCTWFNNFTKYHAVKLSYTPWSLEQTFFCKDTQKSVLLPNCYNFSPVEEIRRANQAKVLCTELLNPTLGPKDATPLIKCEQKVAEQNGDIKDEAVISMNSLKISTEAQLTSTANKPTQNTNENNAVAPTSPIPSKTTIVASLTSKAKVNENLSAKVVDKRIPPTPVQASQQEKKTIQTAQQKLPTYPSSSTMSNQAVPVVPSLQKSIPDNKLNNDVEELESKAGDSGKDLKQGATPKCRELKYSDKRLENVKSIYYNNIIKINLLQKNRTPNNIVIVTDDRENLDITLAAFDPKVEVLKIPEAKLLSVLPIIKNHPKFGKGTIFIFSCGSHDLLVGNPLADCKKHRCHKPQYMFTLPAYISNFHYLIKKALELHMNILRSTKNDIALFSGILPVLINEYNRHNLNNRSCIDSHSTGQGPYIEHIHLSNYQFVLQWFNDFTKYHAQALGFSPWDLEVPYFKNVKESTKFLPDGYNICKGEQLNRADQIKLLCRELLGPLTGPKIVAIPVFQDPQKARNEPKADATVPSQVSTPQKEDVLNTEAKFNQVTIIADSRYLPYLENLNKPKVLILADQQLEIHNLKEYFQKKKTMLTNKTLYLFAIGIDSVTKTVPFISCKNNCRNPLDALEALDNGNYKIHVINVIKKLQTTIKLLMPLLPEHSDFALLPPLPIALLNLNLPHQKIHENKSKFPNYYVVNKTFLIDKLYQVWMDGILTLSLSSLGQCTDVMGTILKKFDNDFKKLKTMACNINDKPNYETWKEVATVIVDSALSGAGVSKVQSLPDFETTISPIATMDEVKLEKSIVPYDYLVFIGHDTSFMLLPEVDFCNFTKWSFSDIVESKNLISMINNLHELKLKRILFIIISDVNMIGVTKKSPECIAKKCNQSLNYVMIQNAQCSIAKKINDTVDSIKNVVSDIKKLINCQSKVIVAPFTPRTYIVVSDLTKFHSKMHEHLECEISSCFFKGNLRKYFDDLVLNFETEWKKLIVEVPQDAADKSNLLNIMSDYTAKNNSSITWKILTADTFSHGSPVLIEWKLCIAMLGKKGWLETSVTSSGKNVADKIAKVDTPSKPVTNLVTPNFNQNRENISADKSMKQTNVDKVSNLSSKVVPPTKPAADLLQPKFSPRQENVAERDGNLKLGNLNTVSMTTQVKPIENSSTFPPTALPAVPSSQQIKDFMQQVPKSIPNARALPHIEQEKFDLSEAILSRNVDDVMLFAKSVLRSAEAVNISDSRFKNIFFVGKQILIEPLKDCSNLKSTLIDHDLSSFQDRDIEILLSKIKHFPDKSACCLVFDVKFITTHVVKSVGCYQSSCQQPLYVSALKTKSTNTSQVLTELDDLIYNKLQSITEFIVKLTRHVPVIVMPLVPSRIYCDLGASFYKPSNQSLSNLNHQLTHSFADLGANLVSGSPELWSRVVQSLNLSWSILMEMNNRTYDVLNCVSSYIGCKPNNFPILNNLSDFIVHWNELDIWKALIEAIITPLVSGKHQGIKGSNYSGSEKHEVRVTVSNISQSVPYKFLEELFKGVDQNIMVVPPKENCTLKGVTVRNSFLVEKLNNCRVGDTMLCVSVMNNTESDRIELSLMEDLFISSLYKKVYKKWKPQIISNLTKEISEVPDVATLKSKPCEHQRNCKGPKICPWFHSFNDKRRNPFIHKYSDASCMKAKRSDGLCVEGVHCRSSHNIYEMKFHPVKYLVSPCPYWKTTEHCNSIELCPHAHRDSPERFFIKEWEDIHLIGLHYSIKFLTGAIRAVIKVPDLSRTNLRVLLISPSSEFLDVAVKSSSELMRTFALSCCNLGKKIGNPDSCQVLVGEPDAFVNADAKIFMNMRGAIIVDDIQQILSNEKQKNNFLQFLKLINTRSYNIALNKVFVSATYDPKSTSSVSEFIGSQLKLLYVPEIDNSKDSLSLQYVNKRKRDESAQNFVSGPNFSKRYRRSKSRSPPLFGRKRSRSRSLTRSDEANREPENVSLKRNKNMGLNTQHTANTSQSTFEQAKNFLNLSFKSKEHASLTKFEGDEIRNQIGPKLYEEYSAELNAMLSAFEEDYVVYQDVPELHPNYENYYQTFVDTYIGQHRDGDDQHKERMWKVHWKRIFEVTKQEDWRSKQHNLLEEYKTKVGNCFPTNKSSLSIFEEALSVLESVCGKVPYLGQAVKAIIMTCRNFGTTTQEAFKVFTDTEAITLLNLTSEKLMAMGPSSFGNNRVLFEKAINCIPKLLSEAKKGSQIFSLPIHSLPIDIQAIARVSGGKGADFALKLIRSALAYEGITNPPREQINDLFRKVCDLRK